MERDVVGEGKGDKRSKPGAGGEGRGVGPYLSQMIPPVIRLATRSFPAPVLFTSGQAHRSSARHTVRYRYKVAWEAGGGRR